MARPCWNGLLFTMLAASAMGPGAALSGPAVNQFEVKDLESGPGELQFQSQNAISFHQPRRAVREPEPGEFAFDDNTVTRERYALEMQMGITTWLRTRLGVEFEKERLEDPGNVARANAFDDLRLTGIALEGVFVLVPVKKEGVGLGLLAEYDHAIRGGASQFYIGPIVQAVSGPWTALANLLLVQHSGSPDRKRDFAYAAQLQYTFSPTWGLALEGYGTIDRLGNSGTRSPQAALFGDFDQHRLGPVVYYRFHPDGMAAPSLKINANSVKGLRKDDDDDAPESGTDRDGPSVSIGVGMLFGLNANTPGQTLKLSLEYNF